MNTEYEFQLPVGFVDERGSEQFYGRMRLAVAADEMAAMDEVQGNHAYLPVHLLSRVITQLGEWGQVTPQTLEQLYAADIAYLSDLYVQLNGPTAMHVSTVCPHCQQSFQLEIASR